LGTTEDDAGRGEVKSKRPPDSAPFVRPQRLSGQHCSSRTPARRVGQTALREVASAIRWYERLLGRPADSKPAVELAEWKFEGGGWLQVYANAERAGSGSLTLAITSLDDQMATLERLGIPPGPTLLNAMAKVVMVSDPDGNSIAFSEALDPTIAR
jgi:hypothetical protein